MRSGNKMSAGFVLMSFLFCFHALVLLSDHMHHVESRDLNDDEKSFWKKGKGRLIDFGGIFPGFGHGGGLIDHGGIFQGYDHEDRVIDHGGIFPGVDDGKFPDLETMNIAADVGTGGNLGGSDGGDNTGGEVVGAIGNDGGDGDGTDGGDGAVYGVIDGENGSRN